MILAALLYPVAGMLQEGSKASQCLSNLRNVGTSLLAVAAENRGRLPALGTNARAQQPTWGMKVAQAMGINLSQRGLKTAFWCPSDRTADDEAGQYMHHNHIGHASYSVNLQLMDWSEGNGVMGGVAKGGIALGQIPRPAQTLLLMEVHARNNVISWADSGGKVWNRGWTYEYTMVNRTVEDDPGKRGYHRGRNNWFFADGHIETLSWQDTLTPVNRWQLQ